MTSLIKVILIVFLFFYPILHSQDTNIVKYFPLSVGNVWVYYGSYFTVQCQSSYYQKISVDSMKILNNHKYYKLSLTTRFISGGSCGYSQIYNGYYRVDSSNGNVYRYGINTNCPFTPTEFLIDSLRSRSGDTSILCSNSELSRKIARDTIVQNIFSFNKPSKYFEGGNFHEYGFFYKVCQRYRYFSYESGRYIFGQRIESNGLPDQWEPIWRYELFLCRHSTNIC